MTGIVANSDIFGLSEQHYGKIKRVGMLNNEPILYGDPNLLKNNDLYYIIGAKQVYRYIKCEVRHTGGISIPGISNPTPLPIGGNVFDPNDTSKVYYFETFNGSDSEVLSVPEDERGKIRNAGYLFNEIIYSGDPNLIDNGLLFYHDTLPYISIISNVDGIINVSTKTIRFDGTPITIVNEYRVSPEPHDYSKDYLTFKALEDCLFSFTVANGIDDEDYTQSAYVKAFYSFDEKNWVEWTTTQYKSVPISVSANENLYVKAITRRSNISAYGIYGTIWFNSTGNFNVGGPLDSLLYNDDGITKKKMGDNHYFSKLFQNCSGLVSAENLILPNYVEGYCYVNMFSDCTSLTIAPVLPATTLVNGCYNGMFQNCTALTTAPELPATTLANECYYRMFYGCSRLNYIKAMFINTPSNTAYTGQTKDWVKDVAATGTFVKNSAATWNVTGDNGVPTGWIVETADS